MRQLISVLLLTAGIFSAKAQLVGQASEQFPVFPNCQGQKGKALETCFYAQVQDFVYHNFKVPADLEKDFKGSVIVLFEVDAEGNFKPIYVDAPNEKLSQEGRRVFTQFPKVGPATYNGNPAYVKYTIKIAIPLQTSAQIAEENAKKIEEEKQFAATNYTRNRHNELSEYDSIKYHKFNEPKFESNLNIPFSHSYYAQFDDAMNQVGANNHTASKPYTYKEVARYYNLREANEKLMKSKTSWFGRKLWNENTVQIQGEGYWFTVNPVFDLQIGRAKGRESRSTYLNTRALQIQGGLGKDVNFTTTIYETQGRFAGYYNRYAESIRSQSGSDPAIVPGVGVAKDFGTDSYDIPSAEANITYAPTTWFNIQMGYGRNFIGDGYRSLITTDGVSPYPYFKLNTTFWKIKYTNTYLFLKDVRPEVTEDRTYKTKFMANHYLSWNASKRLNIGFFESVVWANTNGRGFDASFLNPIIFYRSVEFASSARSGNALLGLTGKYKINNQINFYTQFLLDEFSLGDIKSGDKSWKNKFGYQVGVKYFNAFNIENLLVQAEYNHVRPYVYAHSDPLTNYAHSNQSLGHQWGGNFREIIAIARYHKGRYFADMKFTIGTRGLDFNTATDTLNYGGNIYRDYDEGRARDKGVTIGQGNKTSIFIADVQAGYLVNPATNLKVFASYIHRNFDPLVNTLENFKETTNWVSVGIRSDIFNWYYDY
ncbi:gliding motility protein RemB [Flavobacterium sp.]|uniref:gliding motility protein RemB n=1 Tax=Flavobacterium sp. TaxID=239 RepID=UPI0039E46AF6